MSWVDDKLNNEPMLSMVRQVKEQNLYPFFRPFESGGLHTTVDGHEIVNFSSNDYLGLTNHPKVKENAKAAVDQFACGLSSARVQATAAPHVELEQRLANWFGFDAALVFTTGYQAMVGIIMALADQDTSIILDNLSHACILDGTFLGAGVPKQGAEVRFFNHNSAKSLERILRSKQRKNALVICEGIYSLDGDMGNVKELVEVCERHDAVMICDDAHGTGTLGKRGTGIIEHLGLQGRIPIVITTFSKTFGGIGGVLLGSDDLIEYVKHTARSFVFSASLPVPIVAAASTILTILEEDGPALVAELHDNAHYMRSRLTEIGFDLGHSNTHIMPIMCRDLAKTMFMHGALFENGINMVPIPYPGVKEGEERLRLNITRGHSKADMDKALDLLTRFGKEFKVLPD